MAFKFSLHHQRLLDHRRVTSMDSHISAVLLSISTQKVWATMDMVKDQSVRITGLVQSDLMNTCGGLFTVPAATFWSITLSITSGDFSIPLFSIALVSKRIKITKAKNDLMRVRRINHCHHAYPLQLEHRLWQLNPYSEDPRVNPNRQCRHAQVNRPQSTKILRRIPLA